MSSRSRSTILHRQGSKNPSARSPRRGRFIPLLERLEDRLAPATNMWQGASADWTANPATNWSQGHVPVAGEDVQITNGATVTHSVNSVGAPAGDEVASVPPIFD